MSATYRLTHAYPDCPVCDSAVVTVEHESIDRDDRDRYFDTAQAIHAKGNPYMLRPCGHEMHGCLLQATGAGDAKITEWHETVADSGAKMHHPVPRRNS